MREEWKIVEDKGRVLEVSNLGRVRTVPTKYLNRYGNPSISKQKILKHQLNACGYLTVQYCFTGKHIGHLVSRLVCKAFVPGYQQGLTVNHKDGNKLNNRPENLEWVSHQDNMRHALSTGLLDNAGENHGFAKLSEDDVLAIRASAKNGPELARQYGIKKSTVYNIRARRLWKHI